MVYKEGQFDAVELMVNNQSKLFLYQFECLNALDANGMTIGTHKILGKCSTLEVINYSGRSSHEQPLLIFTNASKWSGAFLSEKQMT